MGLTWLHTGLYLSPGLFRIISSCLTLKLDTPMDLANPASLHFSRAWGGRVVRGHVCNWLEKPNGSTMRVGGGDGREYEPEQERKS